MFSKLVRTAAQRRSPKSMVQIPGFTPSNQSRLIRRETSTPPRQAYLHDRSAAGVNVYASDSTGNAKPIAVISGPNTGIDKLEGIAVDSKGSIYVTNNAGSASILVFPAGSSGDVRPTAVIGLSKTSGGPTRVGFEGERLCCEVQW